MQDENHRLAFASALRVLGRSGKSWETCSMVGNGHHLSISLKYLPNIFPICGDPVWPGLGILAGKIRCNTDVVQR